MKPCRSVRTVGAFGKSILAIYSHLRWRKCSKDFWTFASLDGICPTFGNLRKAVYQCFNNMKIINKAVNTSIYSRIVSDEGPSNLRPDITAVNGALPRQVEEGAFKRHLTMRSAYATVSLQFNTPSLYPSESLQTSLLHDEGRMSQPPQMDCRRLWDTIRACVIAVEATWEENDPYCQFSILGIGFEPLYVIPKMD